MLSKLNILVIVFVLFESCNSVDSESINNYSNHGQAMVVSAHPLASKIGLSVIKRGGNAVDAAVAVQFALAVVYPSAGNIGGGGFFVYRSKEGKYATLDFRETAPLAASKDIYLDEEGNVVENSSLIGSLAVGVPGSVDGMVRIHSKYGTLPWNELIQPAIDLAYNGFQLTKKEALNWNYFNHGKGTISSDYNPYFGSEEYQEGDTVFLLDLASTLIEIRDKQRAGFYKGKIITPPGLIISPSAKNSVWIFLQISPLQNNTRFSIRQFIFLFSYHNFSPRISTNFRPRDVIMT